MTAPAPTVTEAEWQETFVALLRSLGWRSMHVRRSRDRKGHTTATTVKGWPDLFCWHETQHRAMAVELKSEKGTVTNEQLEVLASLKAAGIEQYVFRPSDFDRAAELLRRPLLETPGDGK